MLGKSFMYIRKSKGFRTEPCDTPQVKDSRDDDSPLRKTYCLRLER